MKALSIRVGKQPELIEIDNTLEALQKYVGGYIECVTFSDCILICNEEGKFNGMRPNRSVGFDTIYGDFLLVGEDETGEDFDDISDDAINNWINKWR